MRFAWPALLLPILLAAGPSRGERLLEKGRFRLAAEAFRGELAGGREDAVARGGLARALAELGWCDEALPHLARARRDGSGWTGALAHAEGRCHLHLGDAAAADAALAEAVHLDPDVPGPWLALVAARLAVGDTEGAEGAAAALEEAFGASGDGAGVRFARAWIALESGAGDVWVHLRELDGDAPRRALPPWGLVEAQAWLDLDDPVAAAQVLAGGVAARHPRRVAQRAEAIRRQGLADEAASLLDRPALTRIRAVHLDAVRARIAIDRGELPAARAALAGYGDVDDVEILASRWYLAHAAGEVAEADRLAARWTDRVTARGRRLAQLVPLPARRASSDDPG